MLVSLLGQYFKQNERMHAWWNMEDLFAVIEVSTKYTSVEISFVFIWAPFIVVKYEVVHVLNNARIGEYKMSAVLALN